MNWGRLQQDADFREFWTTDRVETKIGDHVKALLWATDNREIDEARGALKAIRWLQTLPALEAELANPAHTNTSLSALRPKLEKWIVGWASRILTRERSLN